MKCDLDHCDRTSLTRRTKRLPDFGTSADRLTIARSVSGRSGCTPSGGQSTVELLAACTVNTGDRVQSNDLAAVTIPASLFVLDHRREYRDVRFNLIWQRFRPAGQTSFVTSRSGHCRRRGSPARQSDQGVRRLKPHRPGCCHADRRDRRRARNERAIRLRCLGRSASDPWRPSVIVLAICHRFRRASPRVSNVPAR